MRVASLSANKTGALAGGKRYWLLALVLLAGAAAAAWWWWQPRANRPETMARVLRLRAWFAERGTHSAWEVHAGQRCANAWHAQCMGSARRPALRQRAAANAH